MNSTQTTIIQFPKQRDQLLMASARLETVLNQARTEEASLMEQQADIESALSIAHQQLIDNNQKQLVLSEKLSEAQDELVSLQQAQAQLQTELAGVFGLAFGKKKELKAKIESISTDILAAEKRCAELRLEKSRSPAPSDETATLESRHKETKGRLQDVQQKILQISRELEETNSMLLNIDRQKQEAVKTTSPEPVVRSTPVPAKEPLPKIKNTKLAARAQELFDRLEALFPEHKVFALDSIDSDLREGLAALYKDLGYYTIEEMLGAYGYSRISGEEVKRIRDTVLYTPGNEPDVIRSAVQSMLSRLELYYPDKIIDKGIQSEHKALSKTVSGMYQWLGYRDAGEMLTAYGYTYNVISSGGRPTTDFDAIIEALVKKYADQPKPKNLGVLIYDNPEYKAQLKTLQNKSNELFGMSLKKYFEELGLLEAGPRANKPVPKQRPANITEGAAEELRNRYAQLDPAQYGTAEDALAHLTGFIVKKNTAGQIYIFRVNECPEEVVIPYGIDFINEGAFRNQTGMKKLSLPSSIESIGFHTFAGCSGLEEIQFSEGLKTIGASAFSDCSSLTAISLPASLEGIRDLAFRDCERLESISMANEMTSIGRDAFAGCSYVPGIDTGAEESSENARDFLYELDSKGHATISGYTGHDRIISIPKKIEGRAVTAIKREAFMGNDTLVEVTMSDFITSLGKDAFRNCQHLKKIHLSNGIQKITTTTFNDCRDLYAVNIPDAVVEIKRGTFKHSCITELHIGAGLRDITSDVFCHGEYDYYTGELARGFEPAHITISHDNQHLKTDGSAVFSIDGTRLLAILDHPAVYQIPEGVTEVCENAFSGMLNLTGVIFPESLKTIGKSAFSHSQLRSVSFGSGIRTIETNAFAHCNKLSAVVFSEGIETLQNGVFENCPIVSLSLPTSLRSLGENSFSCFGQYSYSNHIKTLHISPDNPWFRTDGSALYRTEGDTQTLIKLFAPSYSSIHSNKMKPYTVMEGTTHIAANAFAGCYRLGKLTLPWTLQHVEPNALTRSVDWYGVSGIPMDIEIDPDNPYFFVKDQMLYFRENDLTFRAEVYLGNNKAVVLPEGLTEIADNAFTKSEIPEVYIPASVTKIGNNAFAHCDELRRIRIGVNGQDDGIGCAVIYLPEHQQESFECGFSRTNQFCDCIRVNADGELFDFVKYDSLFDTIKSSRDKILIATDRLKSAVRLIDHYRDQYLSYLRRKANKAVETVIQYDDLQGLETLADLGVFTEANIDSVITVANRAGKTDMVGYLMEYRNNNLTLNDSEWEL